MNESYKKQLQAQLMEIQKEGAFFVGVNNDIFKDETFDLFYAVQEIVPELARIGFFVNTKNHKYTMMRVLDEYLAKYFFNFKGEEK